MRDRTQRWIGVATAVAGFLLVIAAVPPRWYGVPPTDSYVFSPPVGSPLWIRREVVPVLAILAVLGLFVGLLALVRRDWPAAGRLRRWSGVVALIGLAGLALATPALAYVTFGDTGANTVVALAGVALALVSAFLTLVALVVLGMSYLRTDRPALGYALGGIVVATPMVVYVAPDSLAMFAASLPVAIGAGVVGHDLYRRPAPLPRRGSDETD